MKNSIKGILVLLIICIWSCDDNTISKVDDTPYIDPDTVTMAPMDWMMENALNIQSIDPPNTSFGDFSGLNKFFENKRIILLGEQTHGDGATFHAKIRLIKYLHEKLGFNVLAFESGFYSCSNTDMMLKKGVSAVEAVESSVFPIWTQSEQFTPLMDYLDEKRSSIKFAGFDCQMTGRSTGENILRDLTQYFQEIKLDTNSLSYWVDLQAIFKNISTYAYYYGDLTLSIEKRNQYKNDWESLSSIINSSSHGSNHIDTPFWTQWISSHLVYSDYFWLNVDKVPRGGSEYNIRDIQMGKNLIWLAENKYPNEKIIAWAATFHVARNLKSATLKYSGDIYKDIITMGDIVYDYFGDQIYTVGFTALEGKYGNCFSTEYKDISAATGSSYEKLFEQLGYEYSMIDFARKTMGRKWLFNERTARPVGYGDLICNWTKVIDGLFYTKQMFPSTRKQNNAVFKTMSLSEQALIK